MLTDHGAPRRRGHVRLVRSHSPGQRAGRPRTPRAERRPRDAPVPPAQPTCSADQTAVSGQVLQHCLRPGDRHPAAAPFRALLPARGQVHARGGDHARAARTPCRECASARA